MKEIEVILSPGISSMESVQHSIKLCRCRMQRAMWHGGVHMGTSQGSLTVLGDSDTHLAYDKAFDRKRNIC
jgi:hypothetical protein